jgi:hypothetical protein
VISNRLLIVAALLCGSGLESAPALAQASAPVDTGSITQDLGPLIRSLIATIETLSDYRAPAALPPVFELPQALIEAKVCDEPCNVTAAYVPKEGIYLSENLDPARDPLDRAALLHELVHYLQHDQPKFARLTACQRDRAQEEEAYAIQNAYLALIHRQERVVFYDGDFDCAGAASAESP